MEYCEGRTLKHFIGDSHNRSPVTFTKQ